MSENLLSNNPVKLNIEVRRNDSFDKPITYYQNGSLFNFTNYTAKMQVKHNPDDTTAVLELTSADSEIVLGGAAGTITFAGAKADMNLTPKKYYYDLEITFTDGKTDTILEGFFIVFPDTTR